jgi:hypothetical protein
MSPKIVYSSGFELIKDGHEFADDDANLDQEHYIDRDFDDYEGDSLVAADWEGYED